MQHINYSIIIPHKNSASLLQYCLNSIPIRDDVQVIVVDDNSDADKVDFNNFPKWRGTNYEYYLTKEGKGAGYARNVGLEHAKGKWVIFSDADDHFLPSFDNILNENQTSNADITFYRPQAVMLNDHNVRSNRADGYNYLIDETIKTNNTCLISLMWMSPWSKIIRKDIVNDIKFEEIRYSNDNVFSVTVACNATKIEVKEKSFYMITQSDNSLTSNFLQKEGELECRTGAMLRAFYVAKRKGKDISYYLETLKSFATKLHRRNWKLYTEYLSCLNDEGISIMQMIREHYNDRDRLHRWKGYLNTFFHFYIERIKSYFNNKKFSYKLTSNNLIE